MIILYELHWSHYCEKIRWALDYKNLNWKKISINAFTKKEMKQYACTQSRHLVPLIFDEKTKIAISDSSSILKYLEETYPDSPSLFLNEKNNLIYQYLIELDSKLGVLARRLGYTQLILEKPTILAKLFLSNIWKGFFNLPLICRFSSMFLAIILIKRFRLELNEELNLYEELEIYLIEIAEKLKLNQFLINNTFSAVDLTLAVYLRPLIIVPFFRDHPELRELFLWQKNLLVEYKRDEKLLYEVLIEENRKKYHPVRRKIKKNIKLHGFLENVGMTIDKTLAAFNDHESIWTWGILKVPYYYFFKIRQNKLREKFPSEKVR